MPMKTLRVISPATKAIPQPTTTSITLPSRMSSPLSASG